MKSLIILEKLEKLIDEFIIVYLKSGVSIQGTLNNILNNEYTGLAEVIELSYGAMIPHENHNQWESITYVEIDQIYAVKFDRLEEHRPLTLKK